MTRDQLIRLLGDGDEAIAALKLGLTFDEFGQLREPLPRRIRFRVQRAIATDRREALLASPVCDSLLEYQMRDVLTHNGYVEWMRCRALEKALPLIVNTKPATLIGA